MSKTDTHELISALADGQLGADERERAFEALTHDPEALARWEQYHFIGDVLRSADLAAATPSADFMRQLSARLSQEAPPVLAPVAAVAVRSSIDTAAANEPVFRWKLVAGFASLAAAAAVGWNLLGLTPAPVAGAQFAAVPAASDAQAVPAPATAVMIRDPRLDELLSAHQQLGGAGPLPMPAAFTRQATFEQRSR